MFNIIVTSFFILSIFLFNGIPISALTFLQKKNINRMNWVTFLAISIIIGFGVSSISVAYSYGFLGINNYFFTTFCFGIISLGIFVKYRKNITFPKKDKNTLYFLLPPLFLSLYIVSSQWGSSLKPRIKSGFGPDVSQNLMAAQVANDNGSTWISSSHNLISTLGVHNIHQAAIDIFRIPSFKQVAGYDYLVYGGRWNLTILYNQILRIFGEQAIMWEIGTILFTTLTSLTIIFFAVSKIVTKSNPISSAITLSIICNASFLYQYFNGGLSQAFGMIGISGLSLVLLLISRGDTNFENRISKSGIFILSIASWISSSLTYIDATFIYILFLFVFLTICLFKDKTTFRKVFNFLLLPGISAALLVPNFIYSILINLDYRSAAASGTGTTTGIWKTPSQLIGIFNVFSMTNDNQSKILWYSSILISILILLYFLSNIIRPKSEYFVFVNIAVSSSIVCVIGFYLNYFGNNRSDYIYNKIVVYLSPLIILSLLILFTQHFDKNNTNKFSKTLFLLVTFVIIGSGISFTEKFNSSKEVLIIPTEYSKLLKDRSLEDYLKSKNYLAPYKPAYNFAGLFGAEFWISKAPNDIKLSSRINNKLTIFCFAGDEACKPMTEDITNTNLKQFGILEFNTTLTTEEFSNLTILEKYNYNFDIIGMPRSEVPKKFLGGNPYLK